MARKVSVQFSGFNIPYLGKFKADVGFSSLLATTRIRQLAIYAKPSREGGRGGANRDHLIFLILVEVKVAEPDLNFYLLTAIKSKSNA